MIRKVLLGIAVIACAGVASGQTAQSTPRQNTSFDLSEYGVSLQPEPRLIVVMAALEAAGFDPTPAGKEMSAFRALVR